MKYISDGKFGKFGKFDVIHVPKDLRKRASMGK